jgi:ZIP family zinc transporter
MFNQAFLMTTLAGLSTMLGAIFIFKKENNTTITKSLAFAAGVMITVSIIDLLPESFHELSTIFKIIPSILLILISFNVGIIISSFVRKKAIKTENTLYKVGIISMIAIILHNIPEGIATYLSCENNFTIGLKLTLAIALHNIPEGISISIPIYYATKNKKKALFYTFISGTSEILGAIISYLFLNKIKGEVMMGFLYALIAGIMISISIKELLPTSLSSKEKKTTFRYFMIGIFFMILSHILI